MEWDDIQFNSCANKNPFSLGIPKLVGFVVISG